MKIQYKNKTYEQTNWTCCDCQLIGWKLGVSYYYSCFMPFIKQNCCEHAFKRKLFNDEIFKL